MNKLEKLEQEAFDDKVRVHDFYLGKEDLKGFYIDGNVAINTSVNNNAERICILAEELGHHYTSYGNILDQTSLDNRKQEFRARVWAYQKIITMDKLISAHQKGCRNSYEIAEELDITEEFLLEGINVFKQKYPAVIQYKGYLIQFNPNLDIYRYNA